MQDLNDLVFFAQVVEKGSFTSASESLGVTTSRLSRRVADLESRLGVRLLQRTTRKLSLTDVGQLYYQHCRAIVTEAEAADEAIARVQAKPRGKIRITCPALFAQTPLGPIVVDFMRLNPEVKVQVVASDRRVDLIEEGLDVAVRALNAPAEDSSLVYRLIGMNHTLLVASPSYLEKHGRPRAPEDLKRLCSLGKLNRDGNYVWPLAQADSAPLHVAHQPILESDDWTLLKQAAVDGLGLLALPEQVCYEEVAAGSLERVLPDWSLPSGYLYIVYPSRRGLVPAVRSFIDFAAQRLAGCVLPGNGGDCMAANRIGSD